MFGQLFLCYNKAYKKCTLIVENNDVISTEMMLDLSDKGIYGLSSRVECVGHTSHPVIDFLSWIA